MVAEVVKSKQIAFGSVLIVLVGLTVIFSGIGEAGIFPGPGPSEERQGGEVRVEFNRSVEVSGIKITLKSLRVSAFTTIAEVELVPDSDLDLRMPEIVPLGPENIATIGFNELPVRSGSLAAFPTGPGGDSQTTHILLGPVDSEARTVRIVIDEITIRSSGQRDWQTITGPWVFDVGVDTIPADWDVRTLVLNERVERAGRSLTVEQVLVAENEIAVVYSVDLGEAALPMGRLLSVRTTHGDTVVGFSIQGPEKHATDTRMEVFPIGLDDSWPIEIVAGDFIVTEAYTLEISFPITADVRGPVHEHVEQVLNVDLEIAGYPAKVVSLRSSPQPEGDAFDVLIEATVVEGESVYVLAPGRNEIIARDDLGNVYAYVAGGFGDGLTGLRFRGPIDPQAQELTLSVDRIGREMSFDATVKVHIRQP